MSGVDATIVRGPNRTFGGGPGPPTSPDHRQPHRATHTVGAGPYPEALIWHLSRCSTAPDFRYPLPVPTGLQTAFIDAYARSTDGRVVSVGSIRVIGCESKARINKRSRIELGA